jgi:hypothetical protein
MTVDEFDTDAKKWLAAGLERLDIRESRLCLDHRRHPVEAVHKLAVDRMLYPKRAVLVKSGNALFGRYELWACRVIARTKSRIACLPGPSFQEGSGSPAIAVCVSAEMGRSVPDKAGSTAKTESSARREKKGFGVTVAPFQTDEPARDLVAQPLSVRVPICAHARFSACKLRRLAGAIDTPNGYAVRSRVPRDIEICRFSCIQRKLRPRQEG